MHTIRKKESTSISNNQVFRYIIQAFIIAIGKQKMYNRKVWGYSYFKKTCIFAIQISPGGEIGRHASLRGWCLHGCASSNLVLGTKEA